MKLYEKYKMITKDLGQLEKAYFTTFNLSPEFIERYILPPLLCVDIPSNELGYEELNDKLKNKKPDIKFFHDGNMSKFDEAKRTSVEFYPIILKNGVFHPKVIWLEGENGAFLMVGSGNLTLNGWGRNIEAFRIIKVTKNDNIYKQSHNFFVDVFEKAGLEKKKKKPTQNSESRNLIYGYDKQSSFLESLKLKENLQVYSPYFSDLDELANNEQLKKLTSIKVIPNINKNDKVCLTKLPTKEKITFHKDEDAEEKFNHSKVWISDSKIAIGSHNMTKQAIFGDNFEASIVENLTTTSFNIENNKFKPSILEEGELITEEEDVAPKDSFNCNFKLTANWKERTFKIEKIGETSHKKSLKIILPSKVKTCFKNISKLNDIEKESILSSMIRDKSFSVYDKDKLIFRGFITEEETSYRYEIKAENLEDIFLAFEEKDEAILKEHLIQRVLNQTKEGNHTIKKHNFDKNYFTMFKGFKKLNEKLEKIKSKKELHRFCFSSTISITAIMRILDNENT